MAICSFAVQKLLPESKTQPRIAPRIAIAHSAAGKGSLYGYWLTGSTLECHFWISEEGVIEQYMDTQVRADANYKANDFAISIETESSVSATERWNPKQAAALIKLTDWICKAHGIPRSLTKTWDGSGLGYHIQFGAPGQWTPVSKSCPGPARIGQFKAEIVPAVAKLGNTKKPKVGFSLGDKGEGVAFIQACMNILHKQRINAKGKAGGGKLEINSPTKLAYFGPRTEEAVRETKRFGDVMSKLSGGKGVKVNGLADKEFLDILSFWVPKVQGK